MRRFRYLGSFFGEIVQFARREHAKFSAGQRFASSIIARFTPDAMTIVALEGSSTIRG